MTRPTFLIIGAARCGTTALADSLRQHPQIFVSRPKEPHFLAFAGCEVNFRGPGDDQMINRVAVTELPDYERLFRSAHRSLAIGEGSVSTLYYYHRSLENMRRFVPDARLLVILRSPIERAYSSYLYMVSRGYEPRGDFAQALEDEDRRVAANWHHIWHYTRMGRYCESLEAFRDAWGPDRLRILLLEDLRRNSRDTLREVFQFLGVDPTFQPDTTPEINAAGVPHNRALQSIINRVARSRTWRNLAKAVVPSRMRERIRSANLRRPTMSADARQRLTELYQEDINRLQSLIGRDLRHWLAGVERHA